MENKSRLKSALVGSFSSQIMLIILIIITLITTPVLLKFLNKQEFGLVTILIQIVSYLALFDFGLGNAMVWYLAKYRGSSEEDIRQTNIIISTGFILFSFFGILVCCFGLIFSPYVSSVFKMDARLSDSASAISLTLSVLVGLLFPVKVLNSMFYAHQRQLIYNLNGFTMGVINLLAPLVFLKLGYGLWSFVFSNALSLLISLVICVVCLIKYHPNLKIKISFFQYSVCKDLVKYGIYMFISAVAVQIVFFTDKFFVGSLVSLSFVTIFTITSNIPEICRNLIFKITDNVYPVLIEINSRERDLKKYKLIHHRLLLTTACLGMIAFWLVLSLTYSFIKLWVGPGFFAGYSMLILSLILIIQHVILHVSGLCLTGVGIVKSFSLISLTEAIINVGLTYTLGRLYGVNGIILATIISGCLTSVWYTPYTICKYFKISISEYLIKPLFYPVFMISLIGFPTYYFVTRYVEHFVTNWFFFLLLTILLFISFIIYSWFFLLKSSLKEYIPLSLRNKYLIRKFI